MNFSTLVDMTWGIIIMFMGTAALVYVAPLTVLLEAYFLRRILHLSFWRSLLDATIMNIATGILGTIATSYTVSLVLRPITEMSGEQLLGADYYTPSRAAFLLALITLMGTLLVVSITVEGGVLSLMERTSNVRSVWLASLWSNVTSNLVLFAIFVLYVFTIPGTR